MYVHRGWGRYVHSSIISCVSAMRIARPALLNCMNFLPYATILRGSRRTGGCPSEAVNSSRSEYQIYIHILSKYNEYNFRISLIQVFSIMCKSEIRFSTGNFHNNLNIQPIMSCCKRKIKISQRSVNLLFKFPISTGVPYVIHPGKHSARYKEINKRVKFTTWQQQASVINE